MQLPAITDSGEFIAVWASTGSSETVNIFQRVGSVYNHVQTLTGSPYFGRSISFDASGDSMVVSEEEDLGQEIPGRVKRYTRSGTTWNLSQTIANPAAAEKFGTHLIMCKQGTVLVVNGEFGQAVLFTRPDLTSDFVFKTYLTKESASYAGNFHDFRMSERGDTITSEIADEIKSPYTDGEVSVWMALD